MTVNEKRDEMAEAHARDYRDKDAMRALRLSILDFTEKPPSRCSPRTEDALDKAVALLEADEACVVRSWD